MAGWRGGDLRHLAREMRRIALLYAIVFSGLGVIEAGIYAGMLMGMVAAMVLRPLAWAAFLITSLGIAVMAFRRTLMASRKVLLHGIPWSFTRWRLVVAALSAVAALLSLLASFSVGTMRFPELDLSLEANLLRWFAMVLAILALPAVSNPFLRKPASN